MKTFTDLRSGDKINVVEIDTDNFTIESREARFLGFDNFLRGHIQVYDKDKSIYLTVKNGESMANKTSNISYAEMYYFSDMEKLEEFLKGLDEKVSKFKNGILEAIKDSWEREEKKT